jgi:2-hydroxychromene-2-carboxylate isomerase
MLLQVLEDIRQKYRVEFTFVPVLTLQDEMYPETSFWHSNAFKDACYLAKRYKLCSPIQEYNTSIFTDEQITAQLILWQEQDDFLTKALVLFHAYWGSPEYSLENLLDDCVVNNTCHCSSRLLINEENFRKAGHYLTATIHYGGEWYWGLDRIEHLESRFYELNVNVFSNQNRSTALNPIEIVQKPISDSIVEPIEMFWSIRSPYSYLALLKVIDLAEKYQRTLVIKPVLPMVMRGMSVPKNKRLYIALDAKREAVKYGIDFGYIADPLGKGVERCYALFEYAQSQRKEISFLKSFAQGVWAEGIHSDTDQGLQFIVERCGLNWQQAKTYLNKDEWRSWAQKNLDELYHYNLWGVPSFKYQNVTVFGQDRLDCIELALVEENH